MEQSTVILLQTKLKNYNNNDMYIDEMRHFVNCVKMNQKTINSVSDSIHTLRISINAKMKKIN